MTQGRKSPRLFFIDVARTYAIAAALLAHALYTLGTYDRLGEDARLVQQFTRLAPAMFVFMFGFMVEYIYVQKARRDGIGSITRRIFIRSFQCYVAYAVTSFAAFVGDYKSFQAFVYSLFFLADSRFGNILRAYSVMLLVTPLIIRVRLAYGPLVLLVGLVLLVTSYAFLDRFQTVDFGALNHPLKVLMGIGLHRGGPSVYGALSFYLSGMIMASSIVAQRQGQGPAWYNIHSAALVLLATGALLFVTLVPETVAGAWERILDMTYRNLNAPGFYIIGMLGCVLIFYTLYLLIGTRQLPDWTRFVLPLGTSSLVSYTTGNILLNLSGGLSASLNEYVYLLLFFTAVLLITINVKRLPFYGTLNHLLNWRFAEARGSSAA